MSARTPDRPIYVLQVQPLPRVDGVQALKRALKYMLRVCGLKCISVERADGGSP
jgi:hypothetical protein